jgi:hypothetical protein
MSFLYQIKMFDKLFIQFDKKFKKYHLKYRQFSKDEQVELFSLIFKFWNQEFNKTNSEDIHDEIEYHTTIIKNWNIYDDVINHIEQKLENVHLNRYNYDIINLFGIRACITQNDYDEINNNFDFDIFHINLSEDSRKCTILYHVNQTKFKIKVVDLDTEYIKANVNNKEYIVPIRLLIDINF